MLQSSLHYLWFYSVDYFVCQYTLLLPSILSFPKFWDLHSHFLLAKISIFKMGAQWYFTGLRTCHSGAACWSSRSSWLFCCMPLKAVHSPTNLFDTHVTHTALQACRSTCWYRWWHDDVSFSTDMQPLGGKGVSGPAGVEVWECVILDNFRALCRFCMRLDLKDMLLTSADFPWIFSPTAIVRLDLGDGRRKRVRGRQKGTSCCGPSDWLPEIFAWM